MSQLYLEVTFRRGQPVAAYLYFPRSMGERSCRTSRAGPGMVIDYGENSRPLGMEITAPSKITVADLNRVLDGLGVPEVSADDVLPLKAA